MSDQAGREQAIIGHETEVSIAENDKISKDSESKLQVAINTSEKLNKAQVEVEIDRDSPAKMFENEQAVISRASSPSHFEDNEEDEAQNTDEKVQDKRISPQSTQKYSNYDSDHKNNGTLKPIEDEPKLQTPDNELDNTTSQEKELTDILVDAAFKKSCPDHKQMIVTICTDFSCPKRFWCGICCVKSKDLYVRFSAHMTLISDFLEESIAKLYKVKTFTDVDKKSVDTQLKNIVAKNEANFEETWQLIDSDIEAYKREIVSKIDRLKSGVKDRFNRSVKTINIFYDELADTIQTSKTRDMSHELEELKSQVSSGIKDALEAIESIGNKVNVDIYDVETLNSEFDKSRDFISFIHNNYDSVKENTIPAYISMEKSASALAEKVETLSQPKIKALLDDSHKDLTELRLYYEGMLTNDVPKVDQEGLLNEYLQRRQEPDYHRDPVPRDVDESPHSKPKPNRPDRKMQNTMREADKKIPTSGRERAVDHTSSLRDQRGQIHPIKSTQGKTFKLT
jgi:hypothetical protein